MKIHKTSIEGLLMIEPTFFGDKRGFFAETFRQSWLDEIQPGITFVQDNLSRSGKNTIRGLHYQYKNPQAKLVMVTRGEVLDVAVDVRLGSPTFGQHVTFVLSDENRRMAFIPEGFAHGFAVRSEIADFQYKCSRYYDPESERSLFWNDPALDIDWGIDEPVLSVKDQHAPLLNDIPESEMPPFS